MFNAAYHAKRTAGGSTNLHVQAKHAFDAVQPVFIMRSTLEEWTTSPAIKHQSPVLGRMLDGITKQDGLHVETDSHGRILLDDTQFGFQALAAFLNFCTGKDPELRSLPTEHLIEACRCADFYDACPAYRNQVSAALLENMKGQSHEVTTMDFAHVRISPGALLQSICISDLTMKNLKLARCHIVTALFRDCVIEDCIFDASLSTTTLSIIDSTLNRFQICSHCAEASFSKCQFQSCSIRGGKDVKIEDGCKLTDVELCRNPNDCTEWTLEMSRSTVMTSIEIPASNIVLCDVAFSQGCRLYGARDVKLKSCVLADIRFSCEKADYPCKLEVSDSTVAAPIDLPAHASILLDDVVFLEGAWFNCEAPRITRWQQVRIDGPVKLDEVTFNDRVEGTCFSPHSVFENCNFEFGMGNVAAVECIFKSCKMDSGMKSYHLSHCNFVGSEFDNCAFLPNYPSRGTSLYEAQEASNFSFATFKQCTLMGRASSFKFTDPHLSAAWNLHDAQLV